MSRSAAADIPAPLGYFQDINNSDVTLQCSDKRELYVYMIILSLVSPVFRDMFTFPPPAGALAERRVVEITESSRAMELLLQFCYPQENPVIEDLSTLHEILRACDKYQMDVMMKMMVKVLSTFSSQQPLQVFCVAHSIRLVSEARQAAFDCLRKPEAHLIDSNASELRLISVPTFLELLRYYRDCVKAAMKTITIEHREIDLDWISTNNSCWFQCRSCEPYSPDTRIRIKNRSLTVNPRRWWVEFMQQARLRLADKPLNFSFRGSHPFDILTRAPDCTKCGPVWRGELGAFAKEMEEATAAAIRNVEIALDI